MEQTPVDPTDPGLERRLDAVVRTEMEAAEAEAADLAASRRTLADVAWEAVQAGHRVTLRSGQVEIAGLAVYARGDLISVESRFGLVEAQLTSIDSMRVTPAPSESGRVIPREAESFAARLALLQLGRESVEIVLRSGGQRAEGAVERVARDHLVVTGPSGPLLVALDAIAWLVRPAG